MSAPPATLVPDPPANSELFATSMTPTPAGSSLFNSYHAPTLTVGTTSTVPILPVAMPGQTAQPTAAEVVYAAAYKAAFEAVIASHTGAAAQAGGPAQVGAAAQIGATAQTAAASPGEEAAGDGCYGSSSQFMMLGRSRPLPLQGGRGGSKLHPQQAGGAAASAGSGRGAGGSAPTADDRNKSAFEAPASELACVQLAAASAASAATGVVVTDEAGVRLASEHKKIITEEIDNAIEKIDLTDALDLLDALDNRLDASLTSPDAPEKGRSEVGSFKKRADGDAPPLSRPPSLPPSLPSRPPSWTSAMPSMRAGLGDGDPAMAPRLRSWHQEQDLAPRLRSWHNAFE